ncbi:Fc.00g091730.m01.CDS01 [Cosmosporella sp. VM-42]
MGIKAETLFAVTIFGYRKPGMDEDFYHDYVSETHANHLKDLLVKNKIVSYHMQHNSSKGRALLDRIFPGIPTEKVDDSDCIVQIVFRSIEDYVAVKNEEKYKNLINPDHDVFADASRTKFVTGWFEFHVADGELVGTV